MEPLTRAFVAVPCGVPLATALSRRLDAGGGRPPLRWTRPESWHLTLQFLGDWPRARLSALQHNLEAISGPEPAVLTPAGLGGFPDLARPRVLFLQFRGAEPLVDLAGAVRQATAATRPEGPQDMRPAHPHLTLARVQGPLEAWQRKALADIDLEELPPLPMDGFELLSSQLSPGGARHTVLASYSLRK